MDLIPTTISGVKYAGVVIANPIGGGIPAGSAGTAASPTVTLNSRPFVAKGTVANTNGAAYAATNAIGTFITISGLGAGTVLNAPRILLRALTSDWTTQGSVFALVFDAAPSASAFVDKTAVAAVGSDIPKLSAFANSSPSVVGNIAVAQISMGGRVTADASGNIYFQIVSNAANTFATSGSLTYEIDGLY